MMWKQVQVVVVTREVRLVSYRNLTQVGHMTRKEEKSK